MIRKRSRKKIKSEINIVPLLDILLVLVLVFMITTPNITQSIQVNLPDSTNSTNTINDINTPVILEVHSIDQYNLVVNHQRQEQLLSDQVITEAHAYIADNPKTVFLIGGSKNIPYDAIIKALNLLQKAGVKSVSLMTHPI